MILNSKNIAVGMILLGALARFIPHPANVAPIAAMALFGGANLKRPYNFLVPFVSLFISDMVIGFYGTTMLYVYGSFLAMVLIGEWLKNRQSSANILFASLGSSVLFYLVTNFGVWASPNSWYPNTLAGLGQSYIAGLPFFRNTLLGDLGYTIAFFGLYEVFRVLAKRYLSKPVFNSNF